jgi:hypothetical protein
MHNALSMPSKPSNVSGLANNYFPCIKPSAVFLHTFTLPVRIGATTTLSEAYKLASHLIIDETCIIPLFTMIVFLIIYTIYYIKNDMHHNVF